MKRISILLLFLSLSACAHTDWTKTDTKLALLSVTASALDAYTTKAGEFNHYCHPLMDDKNIVTVIGVTEVMVLALAFVLPTKLRRALLISNITARVGFSAHNLIQK